MDIVLASDFFIDDFVGGAALNDEELFGALTRAGHAVKKIKCRDITLDVAKSLNGCVWIISNFFHMSEYIKSYIQENIRYSILAHDYKFVAHTNPALYQGMLVTDKDKINVGFYQSAKNVFCQSKLHQDIHKLNIPNINSTNLSGNLWNEKTMEFMLALSKRAKKNSFCVVKSPYPQKGVPESIALLIERKIDYDLVYDPDPLAFLNRMSQHAGLCFVAKTPESLSRVVCEAKMCGMKVLANRLIGAVSEPWFEDKDVFKILKEKQKTIPEVILKAIS